MRTKEKFNKKLLVEGNDDQHVVWAICEKFKIPENFDVIDCEGINNLIEQVPVRLKQSGLNTLAIMIDADTDIAGRWEPLKNLLNSHGFKMPDNLPKTGLSLNGPNNIKIGGWIMPDNTLNGMIEDFIRFLVPENDALLPIATSTLDHIEGNKLNRYITPHKAKALIHSWLSWQEDPGTPMGLAITKRFLTTDKEICQQFVNWLTDTFREE
ncbi:DUF3226 domain-containing protein [Foetidibacter luteolus]|uniref:DUF3226 domain-containing protein n=1 Tax=Foetidibacter luteolus TaxID=2608880 RepID=UPI00129A956F|nr:DUF3226 domain-containing protein [Foetidibacter luteolus]